MSESNEPMARVAELWRFPVKSMQGEQLDQLDVGPTGIEGDRRYGVVAVASGYVLSAKTVPALLTARARTDGGHVRIELPDGTELAADDPDASTVLSTWLGREVELRESGGPDVSYELTFEPPNDDAELVAWPAAEGSFLDLAAVHVLTTGSLARMAASYPEGQWDVRRFRPNVLVDTGSAASFVEDDWVGGELALGSTGTALQIDQKAIRCAMPLRAQPALDARDALDRDIDLHHVLMAEHANHLGVYCGVARSGRVGVGDVVSAGS